MFHKQFLLILIFQIGKHIMQAIFEQWNIDKEHSAVSKEERRHILYGSFLVVCILKVLDINIQNIQNPKLIQKLCKVLLIKKDDEKQCHEFHFVQKNFQEKR